MPPPGTRGSSPPHASVVRVPPAGNASSRQSGGRSCQIHRFFDEARERRDAAGRQRLVPQVVEARAGAELLVHPEVLVARQQLRHVAVGVVEIAERERLRDARVDAGGRRLGIDARGLAGREPRVDAVDAERALGRDREAIRVVALRLVRGGLAVGEGRALGLVPGLVGTGDRAVRASDAQVVVDRDDAVGPLARRRRRADVHAGRVLAVLAADRHERALDVRVLADLDVEHAPPLHARRRRVRVLARGRAGLASDATPQVGDHRPARHRRPLRGPPMRLSDTRTTSAPEPVASVRPSDIVASVLRLASPKSFA